MFPWLTEKVFPVHNVFYSISHRDVVGVQRRPVVQCPCGRVSDWALRVWLQVCKILSNPSTIHLVYQVGCARTAEQPPLPSLATRVGDAEIGPMAGSLQSFQSAVVPSPSLRNSAQLGSDTATSGTPAHPRLSRLAAMKRAGAQLGVPVCLIMHLFSILLLSLLC